MGAIIPPLSELFPDGNYEFHLTLRRAEPGDFLRPLDPTGAVIRERARWLGESPARYAGLQNEGREVVEEFWAAAGQWLGAQVPRGGAGAREGNDEAVEIGRAFEPDILLLAPDERGLFRLRGGALCFPTGWALEEKLGHTLEFIHGVVPGLNAALGGPIQQFLTRLKPGIAYLRHNWGISSTQELNQHPARRIPPPVAPAKLDELWLRVEHQALVALPRSRGIVFGIRITSHRLDEVKAGPAAAGLRRALETMPAALAGYKRLEAVRAEVIRLL